MHALLRRLSESRLPTWVLVQNDIDDAHALAEAGWINAIGPSGGPLQVICVTASGKQALEIIDSEFDDGCFDPWAGLAWCLMAECIADDPPKNPFRR
jgi:hypothetical protein